jgi:hypothetical protein
VRTTTQTENAKTSKNALFQSFSKLFKDKNFILAGSSQNPFLNPENPKPPNPVPKSKFKNPLSLPFLLHRFNVLTVLAIQQFTIQRTIT